MAKVTREAARQRRHARVRRKLSGTAERPRLNVFRSLRHIYAQLIDDVAGHTMVATSSLDPEIRGELSELSKKEEAQRVGKVLAERAREQGIESVVFDRGGYQYHGRVKALAEGSREGGLKF